jgi:hypothetical protein
MSITFSCPKCRAALTSPHTSAGSKIHCGLCGQALLVPAPVLSEHFREAPGLPSREFDPDDIEGLVVRDSTGVMALGNPGGLPVTGDGPAFSRRSSVPR